MAKTNSVNRLQEILLVQSVDCNFAGKKMLSLLLIVNFFIRSILNELVDAEYILTANYECYHKDF